MIVLACQCNNTGVMILYEWIYDKWQFLFFFRGQFCKLVKYHSTRKQCKIEEIIKEEDVYGHLLSKHYCMKPYDYSRENMTHCSLQNVLFHKADKMMQKYQKPIVFDEFCYEGDIHYSWGNISAQEMTHRFWCAYCIGAFATHGETYLSDDDVLWWTKDGKLFSVYFEK